MSPLEPPLGPLLFTYKVRPVTKVPFTLTPLTPNVGLEAATKAVVASCVVLVPTDAVGAVGVPVRAGEAVGALVAMLVLTVVAKEGSSPNAAANSLRVFKAAGDESTKLLTAVPTKDVVATRVLLLPADCVGAVGLPVSAGEARGALVATVELVELMDEALVAALEVTAATPDTIAACVNAVVATCVLLDEVADVGAVGVPVSAGEASGALVATVELVVATDASVAAIAAVVAVVCAVIAVALAVIAVVLLDALAVTTETPATIAACVNAVVAICVLLLAAAAVGDTGVPVNVGLLVSALVLIAAAIAVYSSSISVPLTVLRGLPVVKASFDAKFVALI